MSTPANRAGVDAAVGVGSDAAEGDALGDEGPLDELAGGACLAKGVPAVRLQLRAHLPGEQLDQTGAEQVVGVALVGELRVGGVEVALTEPFGDEHVGREIAGAADERGEVAAGAGVRVEPGRSGELGAGGALALGREDRLGGERAADAVLGGEAGGEEAFAGGDEPREGGGIEGAGEVVGGTEADVLVQGALAPGWRAIVGGHVGKGEDECRGAREGAREKCR